jgi:protease IV
MRWGKPHGDRQRGFLLLALYAVLSAAVLWRAPRPAAPGAAAPAKSRAGTVAVVDIYGPITLGAGWGVSDVDRTVRRLREFRRNNDVKAVLLRINSPGGSVAAVQEIHQGVAALRAAGKVVVASLGDVAASGGYYVAAPAHKIVANPGTLTGSIGVILELGNVQELFKKVGIKTETVKSGRLKDIGSPFRPLDPAERVVFQGIVDDAYGQFFRAVAEGRGMPAEKLRPLADGRIFTGSQAQAAGLVDALGNFNTAAELARQLAGLPADHPLRFSPVSPWEKFLKLIGDKTAESRLPVPWPSRKTRFEYVWE